MAKIDYAALKKGGFMRQKQKNNFSLRLQVVGGNLTAEMSNFTVTFDKKKISLMTRRTFILKTSVLIESLTCHW